MKNLRELLQIKDSVKRLYEVQQQKKEFEKYYDEVRRKEQIAISNFMFTNIPKQENSFDIELDEGEKYYTNHVKLKVTKVRTKKIMWSLDKLKKNLEKDRYKDIVIKTYSVNDMQGLIKYLKTCGVDPKKFKKYIDVSEELDESKLDELYELGEIKKKDIEGCYQINLGEPYIKITELKA